jgi:hypothetical protein
MNQNRVEPVIPYLMERTAEEEREAWAFDIAKTVLPAIVRNIGYSPESPRSYPNLAAEIAYEYADALLKRASERAPRIVKLSASDALELFLKCQSDDSLPD